MLLYIIRPSKKFINKRCELGKNVHQPNFFRQLAKKISVFLIVFDILLCAECEVLSYIPYIKVVTML